MAKSKYLINEEWRQCIVCKNFKLWENFYNCKNSKTGKQSVCISCKREQAKQGREKHKELDKKKYWYKSPIKAVKKYNKKLEDKKPKSPPILAIYYDRAGNKTVISNIDI